MLEQSFSVEVKRIEENRLIMFDWSASGTKARVTMRLEPRGDNATLVTINEARWPMDAAGVERALEQTAGWTDFLCCLKAFAQHEGIKRCDTSQGRHSCD